MPEPRLTARTGGMKSAGGTYGAMRRYLGSMPTQQAGHGGVAGGHHVADHAPVDAARPHQFVQHVVDGVHDGLLQLARGLQALLRVDDPADHVFAEPDLAVVVGGLSHHLAVAQVQQLTPDGGGADVQHHRVVRCPSDRPACRLMTL